MMQASSHWAAPPTMSSIDSSPNLTRHGDEVRSAIPNIMKGHSHNSNAGRGPKVLLAKDCPFGELVLFTNTIGIQKQIYLACQSSNKSTRI
jgi:hypothetical protein